MNTVVNCIFKLNKLGKLHIIQLERLHIKNIEVMKNFCKNSKLNMKKHNE